VAVICEMFMAPFGNVRRLSISVRTASGPGTSQARPSAVACSPALPQRIA
jgi:hypothetical protein